MSLHIREPAYFPENHGSGISIDKAVTVVSTFQVLHISSFRVKLEADDESLVSAFDYLNSLQAIYFRVACQQKRRVLKPRQCLMVPGRDVFKGIKAIHFLNL